MKWSKISFGLLCEWQLVNRTNFNENASLWRARTRVPLNEVVVFFRLDLPPTEVGSTVKCLLRYSSFQLQLRPTARPKSAVFCPVLRPRGPQGPTRWPVLCNFKGNLCKKSFDEKWNDTYFFFKIEIIFRNLTMKNFICKYFYLYLIFLFI